MKINLLFFLMLRALARAQNGTNCSATDNDYLLCTFSENINLTRTDFMVYFYSDNGTEETLVDCGWMRDTLECFTQEGFECEESVWETAKISVPTTFRSRTGSYKCVISGYDPITIAPCRFNEGGSENKGSSVPVLPMLLPTTLVLGLAAMGLLLFVYRSKSTKKRNSKKAEKTECEESMLNGT